MSSLRLRVCVCVLHVRTYRAAQSIGSAAITTPRTDSGHSHRDDLWNDDLGGDIDPRCDDGSELGAFLARHFVPGVREHSGQREVQGAADSAEQLARGLLAAALHLRQVAETDPGGVGHLTQGAALLGAGTTQHVADHLAQQCRHDRLLFAQTLIGVLPSSPGLVTRATLRDAGLVPGWRRSLCSALRPSSSLCSALRASAHRCALLFAQALIAVLCSSPKLIAVLCSSPKLIAVARRAPAAW